MQQSCILYKTLRNHESLKKRLTYQEFKNLYFDGKDNFWYELINGILVKKQASTIRHQRISREIDFFLTQYSKKTLPGEVLYAPVDVILDDSNAYPPDIFFIKKSALLSSMKRNSW